jgi:hypothetical protein
MIFEIPVKEIIVNDDSQVQLLEDDGTAYADNDVNPTTGGVIFQGWLGLTWATEFELLAATTRIIRDTPSNGAAEVITYTLTSADAPADCVFRLQVDSLDLTPTEFQNRGYEKRYQIPAQTTVDGVGAAIAAAINADSNAPVTAAYNSGTDVLTLTGKRVGETFRLYSTDYVLPAVSVTTPASLGVNTYAVLKNINWAKNLDFDRNEAWFPRQGAQYNSYYFRLKKKTADGGDTQYPTIEKKDVVTDYRLYVRTGTTLATAMDLLVGDLNA